MKIIKNKSSLESVNLQNNTIHIKCKTFPSFPEGVNKTDQYNWFYTLCLKGTPGEQINIDVKTASTFNTKPIFTGGLAFFSSDEWNWYPIKNPVYTDRSRLRQHFTYTFTSTKPVFLSNTMFFNHHKIEEYIQEYVSKQNNKCELKSIGKTLLNNNLDIITFNKAKHPKGRILMTTGCHPAEPDLIASMEILDYLASSQSKKLRENYIIDIMPMQNPDGYVQKSCLTANGINLYWNFRSHDKKNCPEAHYLWKYINEHPPMLYLDFHSYVYQNYRKPMPYLQSLDCYTSTHTKQAVKHIDRFLVNMSNGYYRIGTISMWPDALSTHATNTFNTIAYTKYHLNLNEGEEKSRKRALTMFKGITDITLQHNHQEKNILTHPWGKAKRDITDSKPLRMYHQSVSTAKQAYMYFKSYNRYQYRIDKSYSSR